MSGNPLKAMMGSGSTPMNLLQGMIGGNPQQILINMLQKQNPQGYQMLQQMMQSGKNPQEILNEMSKNIPPQQMEKVKQMASQFGIR